MPSILFLCLPKEAIETNTFAWIPWKSRTSETDEQTFLEHRRPRNDRQLLRSLLAEGESESVLSEQPERLLSITKPLRKLWWPSSGYAEPAHLIVLKRFHAKFLELALANLEISTCVPHRYQKFWMQTA